MPFRWLAALWRNVWHRRRVERDVEDELGTYVDMLADEHLASGLDSDEARRRAAVALGGFEPVKEQMRAARAGAYFDGVVRDIRYAVKALTRSPIFTLTTTVSLGLGVGAVTAVFTVANGLLLRPAAGVANSDRLVEIVAIPRQSPGGVIPISFAQYEDIRARATTLDGVFAYALDPVATSLRAGGATDRVFATLVSTTYFDVLGVTTAAGRTFSAAEIERTGDRAIAVINHDLWRRRFSNDPTVIGQSIQINARAFRIVGVARDGFRGTSITAPDVWLPLSTTGGSTLGGRQSTMDQYTPWLQLGARLRPGSSRAESSSELRVIGPSLLPPPRPGGGAPSAADSPFQWGVVASSPIPYGVRGLAGTFLALLIGIVSLVLIIATMNVAGVLWARAVFRRREMAVRAAIGAGRARILRQLLTETVLLFLLGGIAGLVTGRAIVSLLVGFLPAFPVPVNMSVPLDWTVFGFTLGLALLAALIGGLAPARYASKTDVVIALKEQAPSAPQSRRLRYVFVVCQVALSAVLVVISGLLILKMESIGNARSVADRRGVITASIDWSTAGRQAVEAVQAAEALVERLRRFPGVESVTAADRAPDGRRVVRVTRDLRTSGSGNAEAAPVVQPNWHFVAADYFETLKTPIVQGREFTDADRDGTERVAIVSQSAAKQFWPGQNPIGQHLVGQASGEAVGQRGSPALVTVVGVAADPDGTGPSAGASPDIYVPLRQGPTSTIAILARGVDTDRVARELRALIASAEPYVSPPDVQTLDALQAGPVEIQTRIAMAVAGSVGVVGLLLAFVGVHGITAYVVAERQREFGIRLALGAERRAVTRMALTYGLVLVGTGLVAGLALGAAAGRVLGSSPLGRIPLDPVVFAGTALLFVAAGAAACYGPARRAGRIDPVYLLRSE